MIVANLQNFESFLKAKKTESDLNQLMRYQKLLLILMNKIIKYLKSLQRNNNQVETCFSKFQYKVIMPIISQLRSKKLHCQQMNTYLYYLRKYKTVNHQLKQVSKMYRQPDQCIHDIANGRINVPVQCLSCIQYFDLGSRVKDNYFQKLYCLQTFKFKQKESRDELSNYLCSIMNAGEACLLIGVTNDSIIKGQLLKNIQMLEIYQIIKDIRKKNIFPDKCEQEVLKIEFVQVGQSSKKPKTKAQNQGILEEQSRLVVIKIFAKTRGLGRAYFVKSANANKPYKMVLDPAAQCHYKKCYQFMQSKVYQQKNNFLHYNIKCTDVEKITAKKIIKAKENNQSKNEVMTGPDSYGKVPIQYYQYHSILVVEKKSNKFQQFLQNIQQEIDFYKYNIIFEKFISNSSRQVYYMTHRRKYEQVKKKVQKIDPQRKNLILMKIKPHLTLLKQQYIKQANQKLRKRFFQCFGHNFKIRCSSGAQKDQLEVIFAFTLLQNANIRSNFISEQKIKSSNLCQV